MYCDLRLVDCGQYEYQYKCPTEPDIILSATNVITVYVYIQYSVYNAFLCVYLMQECLR